MPRSQPVAAGRERPPPHAPGSGTFARGWADSRRPRSMSSARRRTGRSRRRSRRSITLIRDRDGLVPSRVPRYGRILVIEPAPRNLTPADTTSWLAPGGLARALASRWPGVEGHVIDAGATAAGVAALREAALAADLIVVGTVDAPGDPSLAALADALVTTGRPTLAVALRAPWDADAYPAVGTVLATYGIGAPSLDALAAALAGDAPITGRAPVPLASA
jgi:beta-N-acetylhexosaminidase